MISAADAETTRIMRLVAQILRAAEHSDTGVLLKVLFNDNPLIFAGKCGQSVGQLRTREGLES